MTEAKKLKPAREMVKANNARDSIMSKKYRPVPDEQAPRSPLVSQQPMIISSAATSQTSNGNFPFL